MRFPFLRPRPDGEVGASTKGASVERCDPHETARRLDTVICELSQATTLPAIVNVVKHAAWRLVGADGATFVLREGDQCHYADEEAIAPLWKGKRFPLAACVSGWAMLYRQQAIIPDIYSDPRIPQEAYRPTFVRSLAMTPVGTSDPWAAIGVYWARPVVPTPEQSRCLQALANSTSVAMENVRMRAHLGFVSGRHDLASGTGDRVTMCAWTRRVKWQGEWISVERFLRERFGVDVTHGISDEAAMALDPDAARAPDAPPRRHRNS